ncbi:hypothetical protein ACL9RL_10290 [Plantibacter sp. Mn2098]|uniref:hypothetical protein n=1 Tax=Plantibacter sp. Mn2098 TaxID=3395266 RepID=UPI003BBD9459
MSLEIYKEPQAPKAGSMKRRIIAGAAAAALTLGAVGVGVAVATSASAETGGSSDYQSTTVVDPASTGPHTTGPGAHPMPLPKDVKPGVAKAIGPVPKDAVLGDGSGLTLTEAVPAN